MSSLDEETNEMTDAISDTTNAAEAHPNFLVGGAVGCREGEAAVVANFVDGIEDAADSPIRGYCGANAVCSKELHGAGDRTW